MPWEQDRDESGLNAQQMLQKVGFPMDYNNYGQRPVLERLLYLMREVSDWEGKIDNNRRNIDNWRKSIDQAMTEMNDCQNRINANKELIALIEKYVAQKLAKMHVPLLIPPEQELTRAEVAAEMIEQEQATEEDLPL